MKKILLLVLFASVATLALPTLALASTNEYQEIPGCSDTQINYSCQRRKLLDPSTNCELVYCADNGGRPPGSDTQNEPVRLNFFGIRIRLNSEKAIQQLIYLAFSVFLGLAALVAVITGVIAGVRRANAESDGDIQKQVKTMQNAIVGLVIIGISILFVQLVGGLLGLGSVADLASFGNLLPDEVEQTGQ